MSRSFTLRGLRTPKIMENSFRTFALMHGQEARSTSLPAKLSSINKGFLLILTILYILSIHVHVRLGNGQDARSTSRQAKVLLKRPCFS
jgi:hypothetical protein